MPFDDPATHLELTMIHEVMVLDHAGPALGFVVYGAALKFTVFFDLARDAPDPGPAGLGRTRLRSLRGRPRRNQRRRRAR